MSWRCLGAAIAAMTAVPAAPAVGQSDTVSRYEQLYTETRNPALLWLIAEAHAEDGRVDEAISALNRVAQQRLGFVVTSESPLAELSGNPRFEAVAATLQRHFEQRPRAREFTSVWMPGLVPEGIAADRRTGRVFLSDMAGKRILEVTPRAAPRVFATLGLRPIGMKVDHSRELLWVAATTAFVAGDTPQSALLGFDLASGELRRSYASAEIKSLNDVAIAPTGDLYMTDSLGGALFRLRRDSDRLERVTPEGKMGYPNGLAISGDGRHVYVAQGVALRRVDVATGEMSSVAQPPNLALLSIDGLYWYDGTLIAIQNAGSPGRVLRLVLTPDGGAIAAFQILEAGNPHFDTPTTGTILGDRLYFIANSQLKRLQDDGTLSAGPPLKPVKVLWLELPQ